MVCHHCGKDAQSLIARICVDCWQKIDASQVRPEAPASHTANDFAPPSSGPRLLGLGGGVGAHSK